MLMLNTVMPSHMAIAIKHVAGQRLWKTFLALLLFVTLLGLTSCYHYAPPDVPPAAVAKPAPAIVRTPPVQVYLYPKMGQTPEQQDRDRYECYNWAIKQTGFDPGSPLIPPEHRVTVVPVPPPGHDTAVGAVTGAAVGALAAGHHHSPEGALIGAAVGAFAGAASDASRQQQARQLEDAYGRQDQARYAQFESRAIEFRRAMAACLEGRGYSTR
jgi:predicted small lipoprotein YifL